MLLAGKKCDKLKVAVSSPKNSYRSESDASLFESSEEDKIPVSYVA